MTMISQRIIAPAFMAHQQKGFDASEVQSASKYATKRLSQPLPPSIERRNARERNRVKQVNNGFDKLRQYIPAKIVEVENGGRGVSKKLSKVDTLKLAVKYIQRLKEMLDENDSRLPQSTETPVPCSMSSTSSYYSASPAPSAHHQHHHHQQQMPMIYASTPMSSYHQEHQHSEPSVSPAPSFHSDVSSHHPQSVYQMQNVQYTDEGYSHEQFLSEDSGAYEDEEEGILEDILEWQFQN